MTNKEYFEIVSENPLVVKGRISLPYKYYLGRIASHFYVELQKQKRLLGVRCEACGITYMPPRSICPKCFSILDKWVEVGPTGILETWTITEYHLKVHPAKEPIIYGIINLHGADTGLVHMLGEVEASKLTVGMKVEPVFKEQCEGNILDIKYFKPL